MTLKNLPPQERPRERMARYGCDVLSTIELLAIILSSGTKERSVLELAADLLAHFGSVQKLADASLKELRAVKGIGIAKAIQLKAAFSLQKRVEEKNSSVILDTPEKIFNLIAAELVDQKTEMLMVILRDVRRACTHREVIAKGTLTELLIHPREIFHIAIRHQAHSVIIAHNHPSGDCTPSKQDLEMTQILMAASSVVGIELSDHLIVGRKGYFSFYEKGLLKKEGKVY
jgi:DNA repair protein RadC